MAEQGSDLLQSIDTLWFHRSILHGISTSKIEKEPISENLPKPTFLVLPAPLSEERHPVHTDPDPVHPKAADERQRRPAQEQFDGQRPVINRTRSGSRSPAVREMRRNSSILRREGKIRSCRSLSELEYYELKGFMDLGFTFKKDELSPHIISMIPGLQRLREEEEAEAKIEGERRKALEREVENEEEEKTRTGIRPYLSEAWLIKRPDSPLLNLRFPSVSDAGIGDMKKHLRFWARTVASEIHQES